MLVRKHGTRRGVNLPRWLEPWHFLFVGAGFLAYDALRRTFGSSASPLGPIPFVPARYHYAEGSNDVRLVVIHTMEWGEDINTAEKCAAMFAGPQSPHSSAHYCVDADSIVQCVREDTGAWHAPGYAAGREINRCSIGVEHAGYMKQSAAEWADPYSTAMLLLSARLVGGICRRYQIPIRHLTKEEFLAGEKGFVGHDDCTRWTGVGSHLDPGPNFPWKQYLELVKRFD